METTTLMFLIGFLVGAGLGMFFFYRQLEITKISKNYKYGMQQDLDFWKKMCGKLKDEIEGHHPEGRNVTNLQYHELREKYFALQKELDEIKKS